jgi:hypothetical protein
LAALSFIAISFHVLGVVYPQYVEDEWLLSTWFMPAELVRGRPDLQSKMSEGMTNGFGRNPDAH